MPMERGTKTGTTRRSIALAGLACLALLLSAAPASALDKERTTNHKFSRPLQVVQPPGEDERLFVVTQPGQVRVVEEDGRVRDRKFLDIREMVSFGGSSMSERGLLSLAFPPDYEASGLLYVFYSNLANDIRVVEFQRDPDDPYHALERTKRPVMKITRPADYRHNHYGGTLAFGPDGYLWVSIGDGGAKDPANLAQSLDSLMGKLLRIDPAPSPESNHTIPNDNPYAGPTPGKDQTWARGFRNPWRFSFDGSTLMIPDVGEDRYEELNAFPNYLDSRAENFGWSGYEGLRPFISSRRPPNANMPELAYCHPGVSSSMGCTVSFKGCSISGGAVSHDSTIPELAGRYVYGDFCNQRLRSTLPTDPTGANSTLSTFISPFSLTSVGTDNDGRIYMTKLNGRVLRLVP